MIPSRFMYCPQPCGCEDCAEAQRRYDERYKRRPPPTKEQLDAFIVSELEGLKKALLDDEA